MGIKR